VSPAKAATGRADSTPTKKRSWQVPPRFKATSSPSTCWACRAA